MFALTASKLLDVQTQSPLQGECHKGVCDDIIKRKFFELVFFDRGKQIFAQTNAAPNL